jgi:hypothetical protein
MDVWFPGRKLNGHTIYVWSQICQEIHCSCVGMSCFQMVSVLDQYSNGLPNHLTSTIWNQDRQYLILDVWYSDVKCSFEEITTDTFQWPRVFFSIIDSTVEGGGGKISTVYLLHSLPLRMSVVQVFVGSQMAVVSHLVTSDTIGRERKLKLDDEVLLYKHQKTHQIKNENGTVRNIEKGS